MAKVVSIEVGYSFIRICEMDYQVKNPRVYHYVTVPTPPNVIEDGYLKESANLRGVIKKALSNNQITTKRVVFTVASSKILNREVLVPDVKPNMIGNLVKSNLAEYFPIDLTGYSVSHVLLEKIASGPDAGKSRVLIVAADRAMIDGYSNLAASCGLTLAALDFVGNSIYQAVRKEANKDSVMILKIEENQTIITVVKDNNLMLLRSVNYGVGNLIKEVHHNSTFNVPDEEEAWTLLKRRGILKVAFDDRTRIIESDLEHDDTPQYSEARSKITASANALVNSVSRVISFYNSRNEEPINKMYVIGMGGEVGNLTKLFTNETGIPTAVFRRLEGIGWHQSVGDSELFAYVACIGATIQSVSFVDQEKKSSASKGVNLAPIAAVVAVGCVAAAGVLAYMGLAPYRAAENRKADLEAKIVEYEPAEKLYKQCNAVSEFTTYVKAGDIFSQNSNDKILFLLQELEETLPADIDMEQFTSSHEDVVMTMTVADKATAASVIKNLRDFESIKDVEVSSLVEIRDPEYFDEDGNPVDEEGNPIPAPEETKIIVLDGEEVEVPADYVQGGKIKFTITCKYRQKYALPNNKKGASELPVEIELTDDAE